MLLHGPPEARLRALDWLSEHPESRAHGAVLQALALEPEEFAYTRADGEEANLRSRILDVALETYTPKNMFMSVRLRAELRRPVYGALIVERLLEIDGEWIRAQRDALLEANPGLEGFL